jgi:hypothetical protein
LYRRPCRQLAASPNALVRCPHAQHADEGMEHTGAALGTCRTSETQSDMEQSESVVARWLAAGDSGDVQAFDGLTGACGGAQSCSHSAAGRTHVRPRLDVKPAGDLPERQRAPCTEATRRRLGGRGGLRHCDGPGHGGMQPGLTKARADLACCAWAKGPSTCQRRPKIDPFPPVEN